MAESEHGKAIKDAEHLLPAWFVPRMMGTTSSFGLLLVTGDVLCISKVNGVRSASNGIWIDVELLPEKPMVAGAPTWANRLFVAPASRLDASIQAIHVVVAFELADA